MSKKTLIIISTLLTVLFVLSLSGCGKKNNNAPTEPYVSSFKYFYRNPAERNYVKAAESFAKGDGTEASPYEIETAEQLAFMAQQCNSSEFSVYNAYCKASYVLTADIEINKRTAGEDWLKTPPALAWMPIGINNGFVGTFDGQGHTISGLFLNEEVNEGAERAGKYGLFGKNQGTIRNVKVKDSVYWVSGIINYVGGIAGENWQGSIENCSCDADVYGYDTSMGGIVGINEGTIKNCSFSGSVKHLKEGAAYNAIGGIAGDNHGIISGCENTGTVSAANGSVDAGGIVGSLSDHDIKNCVNRGDVVGTNRAGGIAGHIFISSIGGEYKSTGASITGCTNEGSVSAKGEYIGGITGEAVIDNSEYSVKISNCSNTGTLKEAKSGIGGIVGKLSVMAKTDSNSELVIENCVNSSSITGVYSGGIISSVTPTKGKLVVSGCKNSGAVKAEKYAAGIIADLQMMLSNEAYENNIAIINCENTGAISTEYMGGGILGCMITPSNTSNCTKTSFTIENCNNSADIVCSSNNAFVGGITGNIDLPNGSFAVRSCKASGSVTFAGKPAQDDTLNADESERFELSRISGGIVGRIGAGLFLTTSADKRTEAGVNDPNAKIIIEDCTSSVMINAPAESEYVDKDNKPIFSNIFGGIIGDYAGGEGNGFVVRNCTYSGTERGLGNKELPDVGTKAN